MRAGELNSGSLLLSATAEEPGGPGPRVPRSTCSGGKGSKTTVHLPDSVV